MNLNLTLVRNREQLQWNSYCCCSLFVFHVSKRKWHFYLQDHLFHTYLILSPWIFGMASFWSYGICRMYAYEKKKMWNMHWIHSFWTELNSFFKIEYFECESLVAVWGEDFFKWEFNWTKSGARCQRQRLIGDCMAFLTSYLFRIETSSFLS